MTRRFSSGKSFAPDVGVMRIRFYEERRIINMKKLLVWTIAMVAFGLSLTSTTNAQDKPNNPAQPVVRHLSPVNILSALVTGKLCLRINGPRNTTFGEIHLLICGRQNSFISAVTPSSGLTLTPISTTTGGQNGLLLSHFPCKKR